MTRTQKAVGYCVGDRVRAILMPETASAPLLTPDEEWIIALGNDRDRWRKVADGLAFAIRDVPLDDQTTDAEMKLQEDALAGYDAAVAGKPAKTGSIRAALDAIWEAGGKAWDDVEDPEAAIAEMRGEDPPDPVKAKLLEVARRIVAYADGIGQLTHIAAAAQVAVREAEGQPEPKPATPDATLPHSKAEFLALPADARLRLLDTMTKEQRAKIVKEEP